MPMPDGDENVLRIQIDVRLGEDDDIYDIKVSGSLRDSSREELFTTEQGIARVMMVCDLLLSAIGYADSHPMRARWN